MLSDLRKCNVDTYGCKYEGLDIGYGNVNSHQKCNDHDYQAEYNQMNPPESSAVSLGFLSKRTLHWRIFLLLIILAMGILFGRIGRLGVI